MCTGINFGRKIRRRYVFDKKIVTAPREILYRMYGWNWKWNLRVSKFLSNMYVLTTYFSSSTGTNTCARVWFVIGPQLIYRYIFYVESFDKHNMTIFFINNLFP